MAAYVLKRNTTPPFSFCLEGKEETLYTLPSIKRLGFEDVDTINAITKETSLKKQGQMCKSFLLKYAPGLKETDISDMEYIDIFNAYSESQAADKKAMGES